MNRLLHIIGISAKSHGCGKSTIADMIKVRVDSHYNSRSGYYHMGKYDIGAEIIPFASTLKDMIGLFMDANLKYYSASKEDPNDKLNGKSLRYMMQSLGQFMRDTVGEDAWVDAWKRRVTRLTFKPTNTLVIVDDVRYVNEYQKLKDMGAKFVFVDREPEYQDNHSSEGNITKEMCDYVVDNRKDFDEYDRNEMDGYEVFKSMMDDHIDKMMKWFDWEEYEPVIGWGVHSF